jgi:ribosomal protein S18 acetylase RimI-like enzyme
MTESTLRRAGAADAAAVDALTQAAYAKWVPVIGRKPRPMTADYAQAVVEHHVDLIELDGELAALVELEHLDDHLLIVNLAVHPDQQGHGFGSVLLDHAEDVARQMGLEEVRLYTNRLMETNVELYQRHGYAITHEESGPDWTVVHMSKRLPAL